MRAANGTRAPNGRPYEEDGTRAMNGTRVADGRFYNWFISHLAPIQPDSGFCYIAFCRVWCYNEDGMLYHAVLLPAGANLLLGGMPEYDVNQKGAGQMNESKKLRRSLIIAALALLAALLSVSAATFAWYIYHTNVRTTEVKMSAGSSISLQISNALEGPYSSATQMEKFSGGLLPVSTDKITGGFQKCTNFEGVWDNGTYRSVAKYFAPSADAVDYYKTSLYLRTNSDNLDIYLSYIDSKDDSDLNPVSTSMRLGLVVGDKEFIFEINPNMNPAVDPEKTETPEDNGAKERLGGYVLRHDKTDGSTVDFSDKLLTSDNLCEYNEATGAVSLKEKSVSIGTISGDGKGGFGTPMKVDVYLWLEGCDRDCTLNLAGQTMELLALKFAGMPGNGG